MVRKTGSCLLSAVSGLLLGQKLSVDGCRLSISSSLGTSLIVPAGLPGSVLLVYTKPSLASRGVSTLLPGWQIVNFEEYSQ